MTTGRINQVRFAKRVGAGRTLLSSAAPGCLKLYTAGGEGARRLSDSGLSKDAKERARGARFRRPRLRGAASQLAATLDFGGTREE